MTQDRFVNKLYRMAMHLGCCRHMKHYKGHSIHSPFVYALVRNVIMAPRACRGDGELYHRMRRLKLPEKASQQIQTLADYLGFQQTHIPEGDTPLNVRKETLYILDCSLTPLQMGAIIAGVASARGTVVVLYPRQNPARRAFCKELCARGEFLSIDNRRFLMLFFDDNAPKQHYKL